MRLQSRTPDTRVLVRDTGSSLQSRVAELPGGGLGPSASIPYIYMTHVDRVEQNVLFEEGHGEVGFGGDVCFSDLDKASEWSNAFPRRYETVPGQRFEDHVDAVPIGLVKQSLRE